jgi:hypothetical protein
MKFEVCQAKGSEDIEHTKYSLFPVLIDLDLLTSKSIGVFLYLSPTHI